MLPGANYLFLARAEDTTSILDFLPTNYAIRLTVMASVIALFFFGLYIPWIAIDKKKKILKHKNNLG